MLSKVFLCKHEKILIKQTDRQGAIFQCWEDKDGDPEAHWPTSAGLIGEAQYFYSSKLYVCVCVLLRLSQIITLGLSIPEQ